MERIVLWCFSFCYSLYSLILLLLPSHLTTPLHLYSTFGTLGKVFWSRKEVFLSLICKIKGESSQRTLILHLLSAISLHSRMVSHGIKLSQKQRKMIALAAKDNGSVTSSTEPATLITTPPPPTKVAKLGNAWYVTNQISLLFLWRVFTLDSLLEAVS